MTIHKKIYFGGEGSVGKNTLGEDSDLEVNEIMKRLVEKGYKPAYLTLCMYLNKIGFENKNTNNDLMNITTAQMEKDLFGEKYKDFTWDNVIFSDETIFSDFRKLVERNELKNRSV